MNNSKKINLYKTAISKMGKKFNIPENDLSVKFLIDSYQFTEKKLINRNFVKKRIQVLAKEIRDGRKNLENKYSHEPIVFLQKEKCYVQELDWRTAREILKYYHHIGSYRKNSIHIGLYYEVSSGEKKLMGIITFSKYDFSIKPYVIFSRFKANYVLNLSRLYMFDWAPTNSASHFISRSIDYIVKYHPNIQVLITCANPNTGHQGRVFKASNWVEIGRFIGAPYLYLNNKAVTVRSLFEKFGTLDLNKLKNVLKGKLFISESKILPQIVYMHIINKKIRNSFTLNPTNKIYYFNNYHLSPEYGLTDYRKNSAITYNEAKQKVKKFGDYVIAGYLERDNSYLEYSSIIIKNADSFLNIRKDNLHNRETEKDRKQDKLATFILPQFSKTIILCGNQINDQYSRLKNDIKQSKPDTIIVLSYQQGNFNQLLKKVVKITESNEIKTVILYDFLNGFTLVKI